MSTLSRSMLYCVWCFLLPKVVLPSFAALKRGMLRFACSLLSSFVHGFAFHSPFHFASLAKFHLFLPFFFFQRKNVISFCFCRVNEWTFSFRESVKPFSSSTLVQFLVIFLFLWTHSANWCLRKSLYIFFLSCVFGVCRPIRQLGGWCFWSICLEHFQWTVNRKARVLITVSIHFYFHFGCTFKISSSLHRLGCTV